MDLNILVAVASALLGGTGAKAVDLLVKRYRQKSDAFTQIRNELWIDNETLKQTIDRQRQEMDVLSEKYFAVIRDRNSLKVQNMQLELRLESCDCE